MQEKRGNIMKGSTKEGGGGGKEEVDHGKKNRTDNYKQRNKAYRCGNSRRCQKGDNKLEGRELHFLFRVMRYSIMRIFDKD